MHAIRARIALVVSGALLFPHGLALAKDITVCVEVMRSTPQQRANGETKPADPRLRDEQATAAEDAPSSRPTSRPTSPLLTFGRPEPRPAPATPAPSPPLVAGQADDVDLTMLPLGQRPEDYLRRLIEHFVTHQPGFTAVGRDCAQQISVEIFPLQVGWTVFARYSGHNREERVDRLHVDELSQFAERAVLALLGDRPISATIQRDTVLRADSAKDTRQVSGTHHLLVELGTQLRGGRFPTATDDGSAPEDLRLFSPMTFGTGYRGRFENWAMEAVTYFGISAGKTSISKNPAGGHADFGGLWGAGLHFLLYTNPRGITSFYFGGGSSFQLLWFSVIRAADQRLSDNRSTLFSGGLDVDLVCGYEFMRASSVQFVLQAGLHLPAYAVDTEDEHGSLSSWFPGASVKLGVMF